MSYKKFCQNRSLLLITATVCTLGITACGSGKTHTTASKQGTIPLDAVLVGTPTTTIQDAMMTFAEDPKGALLDKTQYLSRINDDLGGQYILQCRNGKVYETQVYYVNNPITKDQALQKLKQLFPADLPAQTKVENEDLKNPNLTEVIHFGDNYKAELLYTDSSSQKVKIVNAWLEEKKS